MIAPLLRAESSPAPLASLTDAEREVLELVGRGPSNRAIAKARGTTERTIANQVASTLRKLKVPSRRALAAIGPEPYARVPIAQTAASGSR